mgnify:CR=1 FL=1
MNKRQKQVVLLNCWHTMIKMQLIILETGEQWCILVKKAYSFLKEYKDNDYIIVEIIGINKSPTYSATGKKVITSLS